MKNLRHIIVCLDSGDTIVDEGTEVKDERGRVLSADTIPGGAEAVRELDRLGFDIVMIADGYVESFERVYRQLGLYDCFCARVYSEAVGVSKPDPRMFEEALLQTGLTRNDFSRMLMVGNNLRRDIRGGNGVGMLTAHMAWTPRYPKIPQCPEETPDYTLRSPTELVELVLRLDAKKTRKGAAESA